MLILKRKDLKNVIYGNTIINLYLIEKEYYGDNAPQRHLFAQYGVTENE